MSDAGEHVDVDHLAVPDREVPRHLGPSAHRPHDADGPVDERRLGSLGTTREGAGDRRRALGLLRRAHVHGRGIGDEHDVRVEQRHKSVEVTTAGRGEEGVDDRSLTDGIGVGSRTLTLHLVAGTAGELLGRVRGSADDGADLVERHCEHVVQHERQPLRGAERVEDHQQGGADRVGQQCFMLGIAPGRGALEVLRQALAGRFLASGGAGPQHVERHPGDDRRQPPIEVLDGARVGPVEPDPCFLHGVVCLAGRPEHPVRHRPQMGTPGLEPVHQPVVFRHRYLLLSRSVMTLTIQSGST